MSEVPIEAIVADTGRRGDAAGEREYVLNFVLKFVRDRPLADDLVQDALLRAHKSRATFHGDASRTTWLCAIALNVVRDHFRGTARRSEEPVDPERIAGVPSDVALDDDLGQSEMDACIRQYVLRLPERQCAVIALHDIAGLTHREVAAALGITEANSRIVLHRARTGLKRLLEDNCLLRFDESVPCEPKPDERCKTGSKGRS